MIRFTGAHDVWCLSHWPIREILNKGIHTWERSDLHFLFSITFIVFALLSRSRSFLEYQVQYSSRNSDPGSHAGWLKLNDGNLFPGQSPRRFFGSGREFCIYLPWVLTKTWPFLFFFARFSSVQIIWESSPSWDQTFSVKRKKKKKPRRSGLDMDLQNTCAKFQGLLKNGVEIWTCAEKCLRSFL